MSYIGTRPQDAAPQSVTTNDIEDGAVTSSDLAAECVNISKIDNSTISSNAEAITGTATDKLMTPAATQAQIDNNSGLKILGIKTASLNTLSTLSTGIPSDDSVPLSSEGEEFLTISYDKVSPTSTIFVTVSGIMGASAATSVVTVSLFLNSETEARQATCERFDSSVSILNFNMEEEINSLGVGNLTLSLRAGTDNSSTMYINGANGSRFFGGRGKTTIKIMEIEV